MSGSSYAVRMADNTVMVLSTSDLVPKTNINGLSVARGLNTKLLATISPKDPDQLLLAAPSDLSTSPQPSPNQSATMLQTFNLRTSHQVSRQAIARNITTVVNVNPKGRRIVDPDVTHLEVSHDGLWLATVDEWTPPEADCEALDHQVEGSRSLCKSETFLRFWSWTEKSHTWEMTTRIDQPHSAAPRSVLGTTVNPVRAEFASAGSDGYVRIWAPMLRIRDGQPIRGLDGESLCTWKCLRECRPDVMPLSQSTSLAESATLAYSEDGSTIAVSYSFPADRPRMVHFIDSRTGLLRHSEAKLCSRGDMQMKFSGHRLLLLSDEFSAWDVVRSECVFYISFKNAFLRSHGRFLAINPFDRTFALALNPPDFQTPAVIAIFDADRPGRLLYQGKIHGHVRALLSRPKGPGYVVVDGQARTVQMKPGDAARETLNATSKVKDDVMKGLNDFFGSSKNDARVNGQTGDGMLRISNGEGALTSEDRPRSLENILEQQAFSTPLPVSELFESVVGLFRKCQ
jgi:NET1-associated nuclear protein 1 (U3 small nucleolar RNA-associated protein 17)